GSRVRVIEGQQGERRLRTLRCGRKRRRNADAVPGEVSRSDRELSSEGSDDARALRAESAVGDGGDADQGDPATRAPQQMEDPGVDRDGIQRPRRIGRGEGSAELSRVLPPRAERRVDGRSFTVSRGTAQYCLSQIFLNSTLIGCPTCIWKPMRPFSMRPLMSSSTSMLVRCPFNISAIMLPRAMTST